MGILLGELVDDGNADLGGLTYLEFVAPGLIAALAMQIGTNEGSFPVAAGHPLGEDVPRGRRHAGSRARAVQRPALLGCGADLRCGCPLRRRGRDRRLVPLPAGGADPVRGRALRARLRRADGGARGRRREPCCADGRLPLPPPPHLPLLGDVLSRSSGCPTGWSPSPGRHRSGTASSSAVTSRPATSRRLPTLGHIAYLVAITLASSVLAVRLISRKLLA